MCLENDHSHNLAHQLTDALQRISKLETELASFYTAWEDKTTLILNLQQQLHQFKTAGIAQLAIHNPNLKSYMSHWERRAIKAEENCKIMREALDKLSKLGNEPLPGNSTGNRIAQLAISQLS